LFYDAAGSELYERITELPEYYLTRTERQLLSEHASRLVDIVRARDGRQLRVLELGAGSASKTPLVLSAVLAGQPRCTYVPMDVSPSALDAARDSLAVAMPTVRVDALEGTHEQVIAKLRATTESQLVLFIGSSIGNFEDDEAISVLARLPPALGPRTWLLLGTDLRSTKDVLLPAYDDAAGVTAAFNLNLLHRLNRELGAHFDTHSFRHEARWNDAASRIEMHLVSQVRQSVPIEAIDLRVEFAPGESIHTESSIKYDLPRIDRILEAAGFTREHTVTDGEHQFAVHLARVR
jgi:dimethylhistidine N-methyltransferase